MLSAPKKVIFQSYNMRSASDCNIFSSESYLKGSMLQVIINTYFKRGKFEKYQ